MSGEYELRVTRRALDDIGLGGLASAGFDLEENRSRHPILHAFASKRSQSPVGQEQSLGIKAPVYNLHARTNSPHVTSQGALPSMAPTLSIPPTVPVSGEPPRMGPQLEVATSTRVTSPCTPPIAIQPETLGVARSSGAVHSPL